MGIKKNIDVSPAQRKIISDLLKRYISNTEVWAYGSRVKWTAKPYSDLDMVAFATEEQKMAVFKDLREAFEESDLPFRVDFFVWDEIPEIFHENIKSEYVVFQEKKKISNQINAYRLNDLIEIKHGFAFKGKYFKGEETKDILITQGNFKIGGGFKADKLKFYDGPIPEQYVLNQSDLIVTMTDLSKKADTLGYPALVPRLKKYRFLHNQRIGLVNIKNKQRLEKYFLYYLLHSEEYRHYIVETATGSTVKHTSPDRILEYQKAQWPTQPPYYPVTLKTSLGNLWGSNRGKNRHFLK